MKKPPSSGGFEFWAKCLERVTCSWMALLRLAALFLCTMLCFASLSSMAVTLGSRASAALFSVVLRSAFTALRAVLW